jgi:hypothetical protein
VNILSHRALLFFVFFVGPVRRALDMRQFTDNIVCYTCRSLWQTQLKSDLRRTYKHCMYRSLCFHTCRPWLIPITPIHKQRKCNTKTIYKKRTDFALLTCVVGEGAATVLFLSLLTRVPGGFIHSSAQRFASVWTLKDECVDALRCSFFEVV